MIILKINNITTDIIGQLPSNIYKKLEREMSYRPDGYQFVPQFSMRNKYGYRIWDGWKKLCYKNKKRCYFYTGLFSIAITFFKKNNIEYKIIDERIKPKKNIKLEISPNYIPRPYQEQKSNLACNQQRGIIQAATGAGKCINKNSLYFTSNGILTINEINKKTIKEKHYINKTISISTPLSDKKHIDQTSKIYYDGISQSVSLTTSCGFNICGTPNHKIIILDKNGQHKWKNLKEINDNDIAVLNKNQNIFGNGFKEKFHYTKNKHDHNNKISNCKYKISIHDAYWLGLLIGGGTLTSKNVIKLAIGLKDKHILCFVKQYLNKLDLHSSLSYSDENHCHEITVYGIQYRKYLKHLGISYDKPHKKTIPHAIRSSGKHVVSAFIKGLYESNGRVESGPAICIGLSSKTLIDQLQIILLNFGIVSSQKPKKDTHYSSYRLRIHNDYIKLFLDVIRFDINGYKFKKIINNIIDKNEIPNSNKDLVFYQKNNIRKIKELIQKSIKYHQTSKTFEESGIPYRTIRSWIQGDRNPSRRMLRKLIEWLKIKIQMITDKKTSSKIKDIILEIEHIIDDSFYYDIIIKKEYQISDNYDIEVPNTHSFVAQGFINHNTFLAALMIKKISVEPCIFFVTSIDLLDQARRSLSEELVYQGKPLEVGQIGGGIIDIKKINVMTVQTAVRALGGVWDSKTKFDSEDTDDKTPIEKRADDIKNLINDAKLSFCDECISGDALVTTRHGPVRMDELHRYIGQELLSFSHNSVVWKKLTHFYPKGKRKILKIVLFGGGTIKCTHDHPIRTKQGWISAERIRQGDLVLCFNNADMDKKFLLTGKVQTDIQNIYSGTKHKQEYVKVEYIEDQAEEDVFDVTIEDTHCFFANNVLVHNCQHWRATTCQLISKGLKSAYYTYGLSATPYRDSGDDLVIHSCFGKKVCEITASELIRNGYLIKPEIKILHIKKEKSKFRGWQEVYKEQVVENKEYNYIIANIAIEYIKHNRTILILVQQIKHGKFLESLIPDSLFLSGNSPKKIRITSLNKLRNKEISCILSTSIFDEGIDVRPLDTLILAGGGKSRVRAMQRIGRILRPFTLKDDNGNIIEQKKKATAIDFRLYQKFLKDHSIAREKMYKTELEFNIEHIYI